MPKDRTIEQKAPSGGSERSLLTPEELCRWLHISKRTLRHLTTTRQIPFLRLGRLLRFDAEAVREALKRSSVE